MAAKSKTRRKTAARKSLERASKPRRIVVLVSTCMGGWILHGDAARKSWRLDGPHFLGEIVNHMVLDPRDGKTLLAATSTSHLGPTMHRSTNLGKPGPRSRSRRRSPSLPSPKKGRAVNHSFWLTPTHANEPKVWYAGTSP